MIDVHTGLGKFAEDSLLVDAEEYIRIRDVFGERVTALRSHHQIPCYSPENKEAKGWMNLTEAAAFLKVSPRTVRIAIDAGELQAEHPLSDDPWLVNRQELMSDHAQGIKCGSSALI